MMRRQTITDSSDMLMLTGAITSKEYLSEIERLKAARPELIQSKTTSRVFNWCWTFWTKFHEPPKRHIEDIFRAEIRGGKIPDEQIQAITTILERASDLYESGDQFNVPYAVQETLRSQESARLQMLADEIQSNLLSGNLAGAQEGIAEYNKGFSSTAPDQLVNPYLDEDAVYDAFNEGTDPLFTLPGEIGRMLNEHFIPGGLVMFQAPEKRGKTHWCNELAKWACWSNCPTAYIAVGDMTRRQMTRRFHVNLSGRHYNPKYCGEMLQPCLDCERCQMASCRKRTSTGLGYDIMENGLQFKLALEGYRPCDEAKYCKECIPTMWWVKVPAVKPLNWAEGLECANDFAFLVGGLKIGLASYPSESESVASISQKIRVWEQFNGWSPRVLILDYPDVMGKEPEAPQDVRHQINSTWKALRRLSMEREMLIIVPTQSDIEGHTVTSQSVRNFSENKSKFAHVTAAFAMNQTPEEKAQGILRVGNLGIVREGDGRTDTETVVLQNLARGRVILGSYPLKK